MCSVLSNKEHDFRKKNFEHKMYFDFSTAFVSKLSRSEKNSARSYHNYTYVFM